MPQASVSSTSLVARDLARRFGPVQAL
ncbi:MAG: hypothetical protein RL112_2762, partial [Planctomycetota bacterium]